MRVLGCETTRKFKLTKSSLYKQIFSTLLRENKSYKKGLLRITCILLYASSEGFIFRSSLSLHPEVLMSLNAVDKLAKPPHGKIVHVMYMTMVCDTVKRASIVNSIKFSKN